MCVRRVLRSYNNNNKIILPRAIVCVCARTGRTEKRAARRRRDERERRLIIIYRRRNWFCVLSFGTDEPRQRACAGEVRLRVEKKKIIKKSWQTGYAARARTTAPQPEYTHRLSRS